MILEGNDLIQKMRSNRESGISEWIETTDEMYRSEYIKPHVQRFDGGFANNDSYGLDPITGDEIYACFLFISSGLNTKHFAQYMTLKEIDKDPTAISTTYKVRYPFRDTPYMSPSKGSEYIIVNLSHFGNLRKFTKEHSCYMEPGAIRIGIILDYFSKEHAEERARHLNERFPDSKYGVRRVKSD